MSIRVASEGFDRWSGYPNGFNRPGEIVPEQKDEDVAHGPSFWNEGPVAQSRAMPSWDNYADAAALSQPARNVNIDVEAVFEPPPSRSSLSSARRGRVQGWAVSSDDIMQRNAHACRIVGLQVNLTPSNSPRSEASAVRVKVIVEDHRREEVSSEKGKGLCARIASCFAQSCHTLFACCCIRSQEVSPEPAAMKGGFGVVANGESSTDVVGVMRGETEIIAHWRVGKPIETDRRVILDYFKSRNPETFLALMRTKDGCAAVEEWLRMTYNETTISFLQSYRELEVLLQGSKNDWNEKAIREKYKEIYHEYVKGGCPKEINVKYRDRGVFEAALKAGPASSLEDLSNAFKRILNSNVDALYTGFSPMSRNAGEEAIYLCLRNKYQTIEEERKEE